MAQSLTLRGRTADDENLQIWISWLLWPEVPRRPQAENPLLTWRLLISWSLSGSNETHVPAIYRNPYLGKTEFYD